MARETGENLELAMSEKTCGLYSDFLLGNISML